ncbi:MAG: hypothetical protein RMK89_05110 [Armatimonadota bacterium]|nr:hypothetical protein [Armatimonadota bacterium]MDW8142824.1 hypothetical protein [Armatimonadota bacterium]
MSIPELPYNLTVQIRVTANCYVLHSACDLEILSAKIWMCLSGK